MQIEVKVKSIANLQSGDKKDGSGKWYARDIVLVCNDGSMYPDEFVVRITGEFAQNCTLNENTVYDADISFSQRRYQDKVFQDLYLRNIKVSEAQPF